IWGRKGAGGGGRDRIVVGDFCGSVSRGSAVAYSRGVVNGGFAAAGARRKRGRRTRRTRVNFRCGEAEARGSTVKCPFFSHLDDKVVDSREGRAGDLIRRRRECLKCGKRFTTYERIDEIPYMVIKKDGRREKFDRHKILQGLLRACEKRPVPTAKLEALVD